MMDACNESASGAWNNVIVFISKPLSSYIKCSTSPSSSSRPSVAHRCEASNIQQTLARGRSPWSTKSTTPTHNNQSATTSKKSNRPSTIIDNSIQTQTPKNNLRREQVRTSWIARNSWGANPGATQGWTLRACQSHRRRRLHSKVTPTNSVILNGLLYTFVRFGRGSAEGFATRDFGFWEAAVVRAKGFVV